jgi:hypothetical protein
MFGIWILNEEKEWEQFKKVLDGFGQLKLICSDLSNSVVFLDLTSSNNAQGNTKTKIYVKPKNLHLYIPANLAYPPGCFISCPFVHW